MILTLVKTPLPKRLFIEVPVLLCPDHVCYTSDHETPAPDHVCYTPDDETPEPDNACYAPDHERTDLEEMFGIYDEHQPPRESQPAASDCPIHRGGGGGAVASNAGRTLPQPQPRRGRATW